MGDCMGELKLEFLGKGCEHYIDLSRITDKSVMVDAGCCTGTFIAVSYKHIRDHETK